MDRKHLWAPLIAVMALLIGLPPVPGRAQAILTYSDPTNNAFEDAQSIAVAPNGVVWVAGSWLTAIYPGSGYLQDVTLPIPYQGAFIQASSVIVGPDGNMWVGDSGSGTITRVGLDTLPIDQYYLGVPVKNMTVGSDGQVWFTSGGNQVGALSIDGTLTLLTFETDSNLGLDAIVAAADGNLWIMADNYKTVAKISTAGKVLAQIILPHGGNMARGPDGAVWVGQGGAIDRINADGSLTTVATVPGASAFFSLTAGYDGNFWAVEGFRPLIERITPDGAVTFYLTYMPDANFPTPDDPSRASATLIAPGAGGSFWFTGPNNNILHELIMADPSPLAASVLPGGRSFEEGTATTVFASMVNGGDTALTNCQVGPGYNAPKELGYGVGYQPTDPVTNQPNGPQNVPVTIPAHGVQTFVLTPHASALASPGTVLDFFCDGARAPVLPRLNTVDLFAGRNASPPDFILLPASAEPGLLHIPANGSAAFAISISNLGSAASTTQPAYVTANTGIELLPVSITMCLTDPVSGNCKTRPAATVNLPSDANATVAVFVTATGPVPLDYSANRIYVSVDYNDYTNVSHGTTSLALEAD